MKVPALEPPRAALIQPYSNGNGGGVVIARVADPSKLLDGQLGRLHGDVVEALVDLAVSLIDEEREHEGSSR